MATRSILPFLTRRSALSSSLAALFLAACENDDEAKAPAAPRGSLAWAAAGDWRIEPERDVWRHPVETLQYWGILPTMTVLEILPGRGWMTTILAPFLAAGGGQLIVASFDPRGASPARLETLADFDARFRDESRFGRIERTIVSQQGSAQNLAPEGVVDLAILANNVHTLMAEQIAEPVFAGVFRTLRPGGVFGVEQHRAASTGIQDPAAGTGYVQEEYVKTLAREAGFEFAGASDINANPNDDRDHPFGVWTLPPTLRTSPLGQPENPDFNSGPYAAIGESDRMTLKFRRPMSGAPVEAPLRGHPG
jgi:predicted methyltransferase